jgi:hypothetical protein
MSKNTQLGNLVNGIFVDSTGKVGVGTETPSELLVLSKATYPTIKLIETTASAQGYFQYHSGNSYFILNAQSNHPLLFGTNDTERMRIASAGNVTINSTLHVGGSLMGQLTGDNAALFRVVSGATTSTRSGIAIKDSWNGTNNTGSYMYFFVGTGSGEREAMRIINNGNVGIGTSSPVGIATNYTTVDVRGTDGAGIHFGRTSEKTSTIYADAGRLSIQTNVALPIVFATSDTERMRISSSGNFTLGSSTASASEMTNGHNNAGQGVYWGVAHNTSYIDFIYNAESKRTNSSAYGFFRAISGGGDIEFNLRGDGNAYADASWNGGGADYAEYFEWHDGNANNEDRRGCSVSLTQGKIKVAEVGEDIIGVVSSNPSVVGDAAWNKWEGKFLKDDFNSYLRNENGERILNPEYNESMEYISREKRKEWEIIGLVGKLRIKKGQEINSSWIKIKDISSEVEEWLVK